MRETTDERSSRAYVLDGCTNIGGEGPSRPRPLLLNDIPDTIIPISINSRHMQGGGMTNLISLAVKPRLIVELVPEASLTSSNPFKIRFGSPMSMGNTR